MGKSLLKQIAHLRAKEATATPHPGGDAEDGSGGGGGGATSIATDVSTSMAGNDSVSMAQDATPLAARKQGGGVVII